ncbi:MAG: DNA helicase II [Alphaproteobacteria bacterium]|nr:MAG: DNA helicase II [Alphaproteobacteria bacterium]
MSGDPFDFSGFDTPAPAADGEAPWLAGLNPAQREAVETTEGPVLVLAGAGTGKTRVLTTRIAHLVATGRAHPGEILAVTFTNKAANEMAGRVERLLARPAAGMALGTFHSISARWLRRHAELVGLRSNFTILDTDDQIRLLKQIIAAADLDEKRWPARLLAGLVDRWKNRALLPDALPADEAHSFADGRGGALYAAYQDRLRILNACDFGDLLLHMITILKRHEDVLAHYHRRYRYILVDEYQDTNVAQYLWLRLLARGAGNICCVGDDDQSIYRWRGAEIGNILRFETDFPGARIIRLEQNYRSTGHILGAASTLIAANRGRLGKTLYTDAGDGEKVRIVGVWDADEEARRVGEEIEALQRAGHALGEIAILVRAGYQTREFEERLVTIGIPYRVVGGPRFYERAEIRDALAYLRVVAQPDDDLAFERIVNRPKRGLGATTIERLHRLARAQRIPLTRAAALLVGSEELRPQARRALGGLLEDFDRWRAEAARLEHTALTELVLEESGYVEMWQKDRSPDAPGRLENLAELVRAMEAFDSLAGFLEHISLVMENEEAAGGDKVSIMTLHAAKGLEFDSVFLPGWEEGVFPHQRAMDEGGTPALEEERRLAYVGLTRARARAVILFAANRRIYGQWQSTLPSRFLDELDAAHVERDIAGGLYGGGHGRAAPDGPGWAYQGYDVELSRGPGWERARRRGYRPQKGGLSDGGQAHFIARTDPNHAAARDFAAGQRVFHDKFGYGTVTAIDDGKLTIAFEHSGEKRVLASFVTPA